VEINMKSLQNTQSARGSVSPGFGRGQGMGWGYASPTHDEYCHIVALIDNYIPESEGL